MAMTLSVAKKANVFSADDNRACSDERSRENKYSSSKRIGTRDRNPTKKGLLHDGSRQGEKLLHLQRIWAYGPSLQKSSK